MTPDRSAKVDRITNDQNGQALSSETSKSSDSLRVNLSASKPTSPTVVPVEAALFAVDTPTVAVEHSNPSVSNLPLGASLTKQVEQADPGFKFSKAATDGESVFEDLQFADSLNNHDGWSHISDVSVVGQPLEIYAQAQTSVMGDQATSLVTGTDSVAASSGVGASTASSGFLGIGASSAVLASTLGVIASQHAASDAVVSSQTLTAVQLQQLGAVGTYKASVASTYAASGQINTPPSDEAYARNISTDGTHLYIDTNGHWNVGTLTTVNGAVTRDYKLVNFQGVNFNDDTTEVSALAASSIKDSAGNITGYEIIAQANSDHSIDFSFTLDATGKVLSTHQLSMDEVVAAETKYGLDFNESGSVGDAQTFVAAGAPGAPDLYTDKYGDLILKKSDGTQVSLHTSSQAQLSNADFDNVQFTGVVSEVNNGVTTYVVVAKMADDSIAELSVAADGSMSSAALDSVNTGAAGAESLASNGVMPSSGLSLSSLSSAAGNLDLTQSNSKAATPGWENALTNAGIKAAVQAAINSTSPDGTKIDYAEALTIVQAAIDSATANGGKVGDSVLADLRTIADRGNALFTSKDTTGSETGYLSYVFDKIVNASKANDFFTGGGTAATLGNLTANSSATDLGKLRDKWLLGLDLPNSSTEGDTANPNAKPATGSYVAFTGTLTGSTGFQYTDVHQGSVGDCYLMASLAGIAEEESVAKANPTNAAIANYQNALEKVFVADSSTCWGVRFYDAYGNANWVTVNNQFMVKDGYTDPAYASINGGNALWVALIEKAYAEANAMGIFSRKVSANSFSSIEGGLSDPISNIVGGITASYSSKTYNVTLYRDSTILNMAETDSVSYADQLTLLKAAIHRGEFLWANSQYASTNATTGQTEWVKGHAFMAFAANNDPNSDAILVFNPWGAQSNMADPFQSTLSQFLVANGPSVSFSYSDSVSPSLYSAAWNSATQLSIKFSKSVFLPTASQTSTPNQVTADVFDPNNNSVGVSLVVSTSSTDSTTLQLAVDPSSANNLNLSTGYVVVNGLSGWWGVTDTQLDPFMTTTPSGFGGFAIGSNTGSTIDLSAINGKSYFIFGGAGNDVIKGSANGNDYIYGGAGQNSLTGGTGKDTYVFLKSDVAATGSPITTDTITNFQILKGDKLDLHDLMPNLSQTDLMNAITNYVSTTIVNSDVDITVKADVVGSTNKVDQLLIVLQGAANNGMVSNNSVIPLTDLINTYGAVKVI